MIRNFLFILVGLCINQLVACTDVHSPSRPGKESPVISMSKLAGTWEFVYVDRPSDLYYIELLNSPLNFNGKTYLKVKQATNDPCLRGIRIDADGEKSVEWLIEGDPENAPGKMGVETSEISKVDGEYVVLKAQGNEFSKMRLIK